MGRSRDGLTTKIFEAFELIEEPLDEVSESVQLGTEPRNVDAAWHRFDVGPRPAGGQTGAQGFTVS